MLVNFLCLAVSCEQTSQHSHSANPQQLHWHTRVAGTLAFTEAHMPSLSLGLRASAGRVAGVDRNGLANNETILDQSADVVSWRT